MRKDDTISTFDQIKEKTVEARCVRWVVAVVGVGSQMRRAMVVPLPSPLEITTEPAGAPDSKGVAAVEASIDISVSLFEAETALVLLGETSLPRVFLSRDLSLASNAACSLFLGWAWASPVPVFSLSSPGGTPTRHKPFVR
jgi:hypothetical protein